MPNKPSDHGRKCIYLIDDEPEVRKVLKNLLQRIQPEWKIEAYEAAASALAACELEVPQVIISDQAMPLTTGTELLDIVRRKFPETIRILISGHATTANKIASAQQCLSKPFNIKDIADTVNRAFMAQETLADPQFAKLVGSLTSFPALPKNHALLLRELESDANTEDLSLILNEDGGMLTRALQLANSPLFHGGTIAKDARAALLQLGTDNMRALVLSSHIFNGYEHINLPEINCPKLWHHCCQTATVAQQLAKHQAGDENCDDVFFAGLMHDLGRLIFMENRREEYASACQQAIAQQASLETIETRMFGRNNTELTGFMLRLWGISEPACRAVINHIEPWQHPGETRLTPATLLYVANYLTRREHPPDSFATPPLNQEYLDSVGFKLS